MKTSRLTRTIEQEPLISVEHVIDELRHRGSPSAVAGMSRFGIQTGTALGVSIPDIRELARKVGTHHDLAQSLWKTGIHEARILASMIDDPAEVSEDQMEKWASDFDSWDVVDGCCGNLFDKTQFATRKAHEWSKREEEYVKRAGFVLMAEMAVHDKSASDRIFLDFLPIIVREASDERNFVKKAVNWALRQIGKRNANLNAAAIKTCAQIKESGSRAGKWIAADALRELTSAPVKNKLANKKSTGLKR
jgi:3-methyladenine DNA glycosylase AlkD